MSKRIPNGLKEYSVNVHVFGSANRTVLAASQEEAERMVEKMLFQQDKQTPQPKMLCAFDWNIPRLNTYGDDANRYCSSNILEVEE